MIVEDCEVHYRNSGQQQSQNKIWVPGGLKITVTGPKVMVFIFKGKTRMVMLEEANKEDIEQEFMQGIH